MVNFLRRVFIKDYQNTSDPKVREAHGVLSSVFGIVTNFLLVVLKAVAAIVLAIPTGMLSVALLADAINNLTDMASSLVSLVGFRAASRPADKDHPFGHGRIEYISGLIVSMVVVLVAVELFKGSLEKAIEGSVQNYDILTMAVLGIAILLKAYQGYFNFRMGKLIDSTALKATAVDSLSDVVATASVLVSAVLGYSLGWGFLDAYLGMAVSILVLVAGVRMIIDTSRPLIGEAAKKDFVEQVVSFALEHPGIKGVHDVMIHSYGPNAHFISFHAEIDAKMAMLDAHDLIDNLEEDIRKKFHAEVSIHMDPILIGDEATEAAKAQCLEILQGLDERLSIHDFRLVAGPSHLNMIFDVLVPYETQLDEAKIRSALMKGFENNVPKVNFVIRIDRPYEE